MTQAQLVYLTSESKVVTLAVPPGGVSIGRSSKCTIVTTDPQASQRHAALKLMGDIWHIEDQSSTNGTMVNGSRIFAPTRLHHWRPPKLRTASSGRSKRKHVQSWWRYSAGMNVNWPRGPSRRTQRVRRLLTTSARASDSASLASSCAR